MFKKIIALLLVLGIVFSGTSVFAVSVDDGKVSKDVKVLNLSDSDSVVVDSVKKEDVDIFNESNVEQYVNYDMIIADGDVLQRVEISKVIELVDNGAALYIEDSNVNLNEINKLFNVTEPRNMSVEGAKVTGAFVFNHNNDYCIGFAGVVECTFSKDESVETSKNNDLSSNEIVFDDENMEQTDVELLEGNEIFKIDPLDFINGIEMIRKDFGAHDKSKTEENVVYMQLPTKEYNGIPAYGLFSLIGDYDVAEGNVNGAIATMIMIQYRYEICSYKSGSNNVSITDVITKFGLLINSNHSLMYFRTKMGSPALNQEIVSHSEFEMSDDSTYVLDSNISVDSSLMLAGCCNATTSNDYDSRILHVFEDFSVNPYKGWNLVPVTQVTNDEEKWLFEAGIRIKNNNMSTETIVRSSFVEGLITRYGISDSEFNFSDVSISYSWSSYYLLGDVNFDGSVTNFDLILLARYLVESEEFSADQCMAADMNHDGEISNADQIILARLIVEA